MEVNHNQTVFRLQTILSEHNEYIKSVIAVKNKIIEVDNFFPHIIKTEAPWGKRESTNGLSIPYAIDRRGQIME